MNFLIQPIFFFKKKKEQTNILEKKILIDDSSFLYIFLNSIHNRILKIKKKGSYPI